MARRPLRVPPALRVGFLTVAASACSDAPSHLTSDGATDAHGTDAIADAATIDVEREASFDSMAADLGMDAAIDLNPTDIGTDAGIDVALDVVDTSIDVSLDETGGLCSLMIPGRVCFTNCVTPSDDGGLIAFACEVYCDPVSTECYDSAGDLLDCGVSGDGDGGQYIFC